MFNDIAPYGYRPLVTRLKNYYKSVQNSYYKKFYKHVEKYFDKPYPILTSTKWTDEMMLHYTKCRPESKLLLLWPNSSSRDQIHSLFKLIKSHGGNIYYRKQFFISKKGIDGLMYQLTSKYPAPPSLKKSSKQLITSLLIELPFDTKKLSFKPLLKTHLVINNPEKAVKIIYNNNSLTFLENQNLKNHINIVSKSKYSIKLLSTYRSYIKKLSPIDQIRTILYSSSTLFSYGVRSMNDIDAYFVNLSKNSSNTMSIISKLQNVSDMDISMQGTKGWESYWKAHLNKIADLQGETNFNNLVLNPKHHYYFNGDKYLNLSIDIQKRLLRLRPRAYADIIATNKLLNLNTKLPKIPKSVPHYRDNIDPIVFKSTIKYALENRYNIKITLSQIDEYISKRALSPPKKFTKDASKEVSHFMKDYDQLYKVLNKPTGKITVKKSKIKKKI